MNIRIAGELVAEAELEERQRCAKVAKRWLKTDYILLHAGEMSAQELRSVKAVIKAVVAEIQTAS